MTSEAIRLVRDFVGKNRQSMDFQRTCAPNVICTRLPAHWRSNKSLVQPFTVLMMTPVPDGTKVTVQAGNDESPCGEVRNNAAEFRRQVAKFSDLRFVGKSGRGKNFHLTVTIHTDPVSIVMVSRAIKVTVDGPRDARHQKREMMNVNQSNRKRPFDSPIPSSIFPPCMPGMPFPMTPPFMTPDMMQSPMYRLMLPGLSGGMSMSAHPITPLFPHAGIHRPIPGTPVKRMRTTTNEETPKIWRPWRPEESKTQ